MKKKIKDLTFEEIISIHNLSFCNECPLKDNNGSCIRTGVTYDFSKEFLEKEIEIASPTLSECIKEWEDRGWEWHMDKICIKLINKEDRDIDIHMWLSDKTYTKAYKEFYQYITLEEHNLIHKTLKALENCNETK